MDTTPHVSVTPEDTNISSMKNMSTRDKKRRARKALLLFLKNMKRSCSMYGTAADWYGETKRLKLILEQFTDVLSKDQIEKLNAAIEPTDLTSKGISTTCKILKKDVKGIAKKLPMLGKGSAVLVKGLVAAAIIAGGASIFWQAQKVKLTIVNQGCSHIPVARDVPQDVTKLIKLLGVKLPLWVATNGSETFMVPPVTLSARATDASFIFGFLGQSAQISLPARVTSITFNEREMLASTEVTIDLRERKAHTVVITCAP